MLLRVDPDKDAIALLSIPRDLKVNIPGVGRRQVQRRLLLRRAGQDAARSSSSSPASTSTTSSTSTSPASPTPSTRSTASTSTSTAATTSRRRPGTAEIDIEAGYQRLCGYNALQYVRFRHYDNDLVRAARQQDFLREARQKLPPKTLIDDRNELLDIFTEYTTSDIGDAVPAARAAEDVRRRAVGAGAARSTSRPSSATDAT